MSQMPVPNLRTTLSPISLATLVVAAGLSAGCPAREVAEIDPAQQKEEYKDIPVSVNRDVDILFVIDNSISMNEEQAALAANFGRFIDILQNIQGGLPNVHLGVISSDMGIHPFSAGSNCVGMGDNGALQAGMAGCSQVQGLFIRDVEDPACTDPNPANCRIRNYTGDLTSAFSCMATLGNAGCGFEQHLGSLKAALDNPGNASFFRENAYLGIIFIADEDDCTSSDGGAVYDPNQKTLADPLGPFNSFRCTEFGVMCNGAPLTRDPMTYDPADGTITCRSRDDGGQKMVIPQEIVDYVIQKKGGDPLKVIVAGIVGPSEPFATEAGTDAQGNAKIDLVPSCTLYNNNTMEFTVEAAPAVRINDFINAFTYKTTVSACNEDAANPGIPDFGPALDKIAEIFALVVGNPCLAGDINTQDLFPDQPGLQLDCQVSDVINPNQPGEVQTPLARCRMANDTDPAGDTTTPCWYAYLDPVNCADTPTQVVVQVKRSVQPPAGTHVIARCAIK